MTTARDIVIFESRLLLLVTFGLSISCWPALVSTIKYQRATPAGLLIIEQVDDRKLGSEFNVRLANLPVLHSKEGDKTAAFPDFPVPDVIRYVGEPVGPFDAVAVFQQFNWGNACDGGPIWLLGVSHDRSFTKSNPIDNCGGTCAASVGQ